MEIPTTQDILLLRLMLWAIVLFFGAMYAITLFIESFFCVSSICSNYFRNLFIWNGKRVLFRRLYSWLLFCLQHNLSSVSLYVFPSLDSLVLKHQYAIQFSLLLNMFSRGTLHAWFYSSIVFPYYFLSCTPKCFLSRRSSDLVHPHWWVLLSLTMKKMCLDTTFTRWEVSARKDVSRISSSSFPSDDFIIWPRKPMDVCLSTSRIMLS